MMGGYMFVREGLSSNVSVSSIDEHQLHQELRKSYTTCLRTQSLQLHEDNLGVHSLGMY